MRVPSRIGPGGWPLPPLLAQPWMTRRAVWWLRLMRAGRVHRVHSDLIGLASRRSGLRLGHHALVRYGDELRREWRARTEAGPAGPALVRADHPNYLGSQAVVRGLVDGYIALLIARAGGRAPHDACSAEVVRLAGIFANSNPGFAAIGGWNTRGQLGDAAVARVPLDHEASQAASLEDLLQETFAAVGLVALRILRAAEQSDISADAALARLSKLAERTAALMLGSAESQPPEATLLAVSEGLPDLTAGQQALP